MGVRTFERDDPGSSSPGDSMERIFVGSQFDRDLAVSQAATALLGTRRGGPPADLRGLSAEERERALVLSKMTATEETYKTRGEII